MHTRRQPGILELTQSLALLLLLAPVLADAGEPGEWLNRMGAAVQ